MGADKVKSRILHWSAHKNERGAVLVIVAVVLIVLIGIAALAVDVGYIAVTRNELQNVADAAALAATREIGSIYTERLSGGHTMTYAEMQNYDCTGGDADLIKAVAVDVGSRNKAAGKSVIIKINDVHIGRWDAATRAFTETTTKPNAVRVTSRRDNVSNNPIKLFFANIFTLVGAKDDVANASVTATATAALGGQCNTRIGELPPFGISNVSTYCSSGGITTRIEFYGNPTSDTSCAGWQTFQVGNSFNSNDLNTIIQGMIDHEIQNGTPGCHREYGQTVDDAMCWSNAEQASLTKHPLNPYVSPAESVGDPLNFSNGEVQNAYPCMKNLYDCKKERNADGSYSWRSDVPIYDGDCRPGAGMIIAGFATVEILSVDPSTKAITARVICDNVEPGRGGCAFNGTYGSIPGLVDKGPS